MLPIKTRNFSSSLDNFTSALQINSNASSGFQAFAVIQMKVMTDSYRKMFRNIVSITTSAPEFTRQLLQDFLQAFSSAEDLTNAELGWVEVGKLCFQAVFLPSSRSLLGDLQEATHIPFPCQSSQLKSRGSMSFL